MPASHASLACQWLTCLVATGRSCVPANVAVCGRVWHKCRDLNWCRSSDLQTICDVIVIQMVQRAVQRAGSVVCGCLICLRQMPDEPSLKWCYRGAKVMPCVLPWMSACHCAPSLIGLAGVCA